MISEELTNQMQYFVGKLCTIMTPPMALPLNEKNFPSWFTLMIDDIDREAIIGTDVTRKTKHLFFFPIIGIAEEQVISPDHPDYKKLREKMEQTKQEQDMVRQQSVPTKAQPTHTMTPPNSLISVDQLKAQTESLKKKWSTSPKEQEIEECETETS